MELVSSQSAFTLKMFQAMFYSSCCASFIYKIDEELRKRKVKDLEHAICDEFLIIRKMLLKFKNRT